MCASFNHMSELLCNKTIRALRDTDIIHRTFFRINIVITLLLRNS